MIVVVFNKPDFEYDVHSLLKEFFPQEDVQMYYSCSPDEVEGKNLACTHHEMTDDGVKEFADASQVFKIDYVGDQITVEWMINRVNDKGDRENPDKEILNNSMTGDMQQADESDIKTAGKSICTKISVTGTDRKETKNRLKLALYSMIEKGTGKSLPWGTLSGIRPTKIAMKCIEDGMSDKETYDYLKKTYLASDEKIDLSIGIAKREKALLDKVDYDNGYSLYIGIPFCPSTCAYCSFTSYPLGVWKNRVDDYLDALEKEIDYTAQKFYHKKLNSIYIGGGTPTTLSPAQLDRLIRKIKCSFDLKDCLEFTVEAGRPDSITKEKLMALKKNGISRISVNPQTMKQQTLDIIGRHHTVDDTIQSFKLARELGFDNVTIHSLAVKRAARLTIFKDRYSDMQMVNTQEHMDLCAAYCKQMGLEPYYLYRQKGMAGNMENVGYAAKGKAGVYNILIMEEKQTIVACGAGASTKRVWPVPNPDGTHRIDRCENVKDVGQYIARIDEMIERKQRLFEEK